MEFSLTLWLEYILRFSHLVAGIAWIGSSFYFIWLDSSFTPPESPRKNVEGELYMVHGGFYYQVEKRKIFPGELPKTLHWFKWEATLTWLTGFALLIVLYYFRGASLLIDSSVQALTQTSAIFFSLGIIVLSWLLYDFIWIAKIFYSKLIRTLLSAFFLIGIIFLNFKVFSGRGAFMQTGVILGTIMLLNVWIRILPGQAKMLRDAQAGQIPDYSLSLKSKVRSVHNTYFTFPVLFIMLSNHFPAVYNHQYKVWLLILLAVSGALVRHAMVTKHNMERWVLLPASIGLISLVLMTSQTTRVTQNSATVAFDEVQQIFIKHCNTCHSANPTDEIFTIAPMGVAFDNEADIRKVASRIQMQVVIGKTMPLGNKTQMTEEERQTLARWLRQ